MWRLFTILGFVVITSCGLRAEPVTYMETIEGDLSADHTAPTFIGTFDLGMNVVQGVVEEVGLDLGTEWIYFNSADVFSFTVPDGMLVDEILLTEFNSGSNFIFMGIDDDTRFAYSPETINTNPPSNPELNNNLALWGIIGAADVTNGTNVLEVLGPQDTLIAGDYTVYLQETANSSGYTLNFRTVTAIPEPSTFLPSSSRHPAVSCDESVAANRRRQSSRKRQRETTLPHDPHKSLADASRWNCR